MVQPSQRCLGQTDPVGRFVYRTAYCCLFVLLLAGCNDGAQLPTPPSGILEAQNDTYSVLRSAQTTVDAAQGVLANDTTTATFTLTLTRTPEYGTLELDEDGAFRYQHGGSAEPTDTFGYTLRSGTSEASATVTLTVENEISNNPTNPENPNPTDPTPPEASACPATAQVGQTYECQLSTGSTLSGAPRGMVVNEHSGFLRWTPTQDQAGEREIAVTYPNKDEVTFNLSIGAGADDPTGLYVAPDGDDTKAGDAENPFKTLQHAVDVVKPGETIYLRGGDYYHPEYGQPFSSSRNANSVAKIKTAGTETKPITLRAYGDEFARIITDEGGLLFDEGANWWTVAGLELQGSAQDLNYNLAMAVWWAEDNSLSSGSGVRYRRTQHITIKNCVIHDFPGGGVASNDSDFITVENNIIYNNGWWSTAGTHGVANSSLKTTQAGTENEEKLIMKGNLVFANQSLIISHVFSKAKVALAIDEGNGLHAQNNTNTFQGKARVENNLLLYNGKAGLGINTMDDITLVNNVFYQNARAVAGAAEITIQSADAEDISNNLFAPRSDRRTIREFGKDKRYTNVGANITSDRSNDDKALPASVKERAEVLRDPEALDFRPAAGIPSTMGVPGDELARMFARAEVYGVEVKAPEEVVDEAYLKAMRQKIFTDWPARLQYVEKGGKQVELLLEDKGVKDENGESPLYSYEQRCHYPDGPKDPAAFPCN